MRFLSHFAMADPWLPELLYLRFFLSYDILSILIV